MRGGRRTMDPSELIQDALAKGRMVRFGCIPVLGYAGGDFQLDIGRKDSVVAVPADRLARFVTIDGRPLGEFLRPMCGAGIPAPPTAILAEYHVGRLRVPMDYPREWA